jgi:hypothetical protein
VGEGNNGPIGEGTMKEQKTKKTMENQFKREFDVQWIKGKSGNTYLCPSTSLERINKPTETQLKLICVEESNNPQND